MPADVRDVIRSGATRPQPAHGAVLLADVSGFTPLTEAYASRYGSRRGAEEIAALLDRIYGALIAEVDRAAGAVVEFAGDAICCCFHGDDGSGALRCGLRMQAAMHALRTGGAPASISVAVAHGPFLRLAVGDPASQLFEVAAGPAIDALSAIAAHARGGEVLAHEGVAASLGARLQLGERRGDGDARCAVVCGVGGREPAPTEAAGDIDERQAQPWVPAAMRSRPVGAVGELRSVVVLFARFGMVDYTAVDANAVLDGYVRFAQATIEGFGGNAFSIVIDDKGSYLCAGFGAPISHDNDPQRAAAAALALRRAAPSPGVVGTLGVALTRGHTYAGIYGGATRRTFGLQGSKTNLAARLMQAARADQILVEEPLAAALESTHALDRLGALRLKGRAVPIDVRSLTAARPDPAGERETAPELVDRHAERAILDERLHALCSGDGGVLLLEGEPGIGKSRLVRHLTDRAESQAITVLAGAGDPIGRGAPYHGWRTVLPGGLGLPPAQDGSTVGELSADARAEATRDALAERLAALADAAPTLVVLEDAHWLDSASLRLAIRIAGGPGNLLLVLTTRPVAEAGLSELDRLCATTACRRLAVGPLSAREIRDVAAGAVGTKLPAAVAALVEAKAGGNPLFSRELALSMRERLLDTGSPWRDEPQSLDSVEAVIASRVDRLPAQAQSVLKVGSVLGRSFEAAALRELAGAGADAQLAVLERLDLLGREGAGRGVLAFRHALIRDVVYEQLLYASRRDLHRRAAEILERPGSDGEPVTTHAVLGHHWQHAGLPQRAAPHFAAAGESAFEAGAFQECADMLERALELSDETLDLLRRARWQWQIAESCYRIGALDRSRRHAEDAIAALDRPVPAERARLVAGTLRELLRQTLYRLAPRGALARRVPVAERERVRLAAEAQLIMAEVYYLSSDIPRSSYVAVRSLNLAERLGPSTELAWCFGATCIIAGIVGAHRQAERYGELARSTADAIDDPFAIALTLHQQCMYLTTRGPYARFAQEYLRCIAGFRALGHKPRLRDAISIAAIGDHLFGRPVEAERKMLDLLAGVEPQETSLGVRWAHTWIGIIALRRGDPQTALQRLRVAAELARNETLDMTSITIHAASALALRRCGDIEAAGREEAAAWTLVDRLGPRPTGHAVLDGYAALAELAMLRWDEARGRRQRLRARERARTACRNLRRYERVFTIGGPARWLYEGELRLRQGSHERALRAWERARCRAAELDMRHELALAHCVLGDHLPPGGAEREHHREAGAQLLLDLATAPHTRPVTPTPDHAQANPGDTHARR